MATVIDSPIRPIPQYGYSHTNTVSSADDDEDQSLSSSSYDHVSAYSSYSRAESPINLGAESPGSVLKPAITPVGSLTPALPSSLSISSLADDGNDDGKTHISRRRRRSSGGRKAAAEWEKAGINAVPDVPARSRLWRSASFYRKKAEARQLKKDEGGDCGICFEIAVHPRKMNCCGSVFCLEHISNWIYGASSDGRCPTCKTSYLSHPNRPHTLPTPPASPRPIIWDLPYRSTSQPPSDVSSSEDEADAIPQDPNAPMTDEARRRLAEQGKNESEENHLYERIISVVGLTVVMCLVVGWS